MKRPKDRFDRNKELGRRLRECRVKAGLTQQMLATAMGRQGKGSHHVAGRLERGEVPYPSLGLIADYLRACRVGFADILVVLDPYTSQPTVVDVETEKAVAKVRKYLPAKLDRAVERFDRGIKRRAEEKHEPLPPARERVRRVRSFALSQIWARRVRREVVRIIETRYLIPGPDNEQKLQNYAAKVWGILNRTRGKRGDMRQALLEAATRSYMEKGGPEPEHLDAVREGLVAFFRQAEIADVLDTKPVPAPGEGRPKYGFQPKPDRRPERDVWDKARESLVEQLWQETSRMPELAGLDPKRLLPWRSVVRQLCSAVDHHAPESEECRREVETLATDEHYTRRGRDPVLVRRLAEVVIPRWEELRQSLGPHPLGRVRPPAKHN